MKIIRIDSTGHTEVEVETAEAAIAEVEKMMNDPAVRGRYSLLVEDPPGTNAVRTAEPADLKDASPEAKVWLVPQLVGGGA